MQFIFNSIIPYKIDMHNELNIYINTYLYASIKKYKYIYMYS